MILKIKALKTYLLCGEEEYLKLNYKNRLIKSIAGDDTMNLECTKAKTLTLTKL